MPILRYNNKLCLYTHIPKCGGISIEMYCAKNGMKIAFRDNHYVSRPAVQKWNISSPQHIDGNSLARLFPNNFFDVYFTVVRHPVSKLRSAFKFQKHVEHKIPANVSISEFVKTDLKQNALIYGYFDNHFLPQTKHFMPGQNYQVFKIEDGLGQVKEFIDFAILGKTSEIEMGHANKSPVTESRPGVDEELDDASKEIVMELYKADFQHLNYQIDA